MPTSEMMNVRGILLIDMKKKTSGQRKSKYEYTGDEIKKYKERRNKRRYVSLSLCFLTLSQLFFVSIFLLIII